MVDSLEGFPEGLPTEAIIAVNAALTEQKEAIEQIRQLDVGGGVQLDLPERYLRALGAVPFCGAKLACGALIVGPACEVCGALPKLFDPRAGAFVRTPTHK